MATLQSEALRRAAHVFLRDVDGTVLSNASLLNSSIFDLDTLSSLLQDLKLQLDVRLAVIAKRRNGLISVNKLPTELAVAVLMIATTPYEPRTGLCRQLASVQTRWWHIIKQGECFWTDIDFADSDDEIRLRLRKSGNSPLNISTTTATSEKLSDLVPLVRVHPHIHRWRSLRGQVTQRLSQCLETPMPVLETLELTFTAGFRNPSPRPVSFLNAPRLQYVAVQYVTVPFSQLSNLRFLSIKGVPTSSITFEVLAQVLGSSPKLTSLVLESVEGAVAAAPESTPQPPVELPRLTNLTLKWIHPALMIGLLSSIHVEEFRTLRVILTQDCLANSGLDLISLLRDSPHLLSFLESRGILPITLKLGSERLHLEATSPQGDESGLLMSIRGRNWTSIVAASRPFATGFRWPVAACYEQESRRSDLLEEASLYLGLPTVTSISLLHKASEVIERLSQPDWIWPQLARIQVTSLLAAAVGKASWKGLMQKLAQLVDLRRNVHGVSPILVLDQEHRVVVSIGACPFQ